MSPSNHRKDRYESHGNLANDETHNTVKKNALYGERVKCFLTSIEKSSFRVHPFYDPGDAIIEVDKKYLRMNNMGMLDNALSDCLGYLEK